MVKIGRHHIELTHPDKIFWPEEGISKKMLIDYYQSISKYLLPFLKGRPQSLLRHPDGIHGTSFFHKDAGENVPSYVKTFQVLSVSTQKMIDYLICDNAATLAYLNNLGCIELNPWHSIWKRPDHPDYLIIAIDPTAENEFDKVLEVTIMFKEFLDKAGIQSYCKTSGASGMHIYLPTAKRYDYAEVRLFAKGLCTMVHDRLPHLTTLERPIAKRNGKIYLDYLQNSKGQTMASVFSVRPRIGAPVSMPLDWKELRPGFRPEAFHIFNAAEQAKKRLEFFLPVLGKSVLLDIRKLD